MAGLFKRDVMMLSVLMVIESVRLVSKWVSSREVVLKFSKGECMLSGFMWKCESLVPNSSKICKVDDYKKDKPNTSDGWARGREIVQE